MGEQLTEIPQDVVKLDKLDAQWYRDQLEGLKGEILSKEKTIVLLEEIKDKRWDKTKNSPQDSAKYVYALQAALYFMGYGDQVGEIDALFGPKTKTALSTFQKDYMHQNANGYPGPRTITALIDALNGKDFTKPEGSTSPANTETPSVPTIPEVVKEEFDYENKLPPEIDDLIKSRRGYKCEYQSQEDNLYYYHILKDDQRVIGIMINANTKDLYSYDLMEGKNYVASDNKERGKSDVITREDLIAALDTIDRDFEKKILSPKQKALKVIAGLLKADDRFSNNEINWNGSMRTFKLDIKGNIAVLARNGYVEFFQKTVSVENYGVNNHKEFVDFLNNNKDALQQIMAGTKAEEITPITAATPSSKEANQDQTIENTTESNKKALLKDLAVNIVAASLDIDWTEDEPFIIDYDATSGTINGIDVDVNGPIIDKQIFKVKGTDADGFTVTSVISDDSYPIRNRFKFDKVEDLVNYLNENKNEIENQITHHQASNGVLISHREAVRNDPDNRQNHIELGNTLYELGQYDEAIESYREAIRKDPRHSRPYSKIAHSLYKQGKYDEAIVECSKAIELEPTNPDYHSDLGDIFYKQGKYDKAIISYGEAIKLNPDEPKYQQYLNNALKKQKAQSAQ